MITKNKQNNENKNSKRDKLYYADSQMSHNHQIKPIMTRHLSTIWTVENSFGGNVKVSPGANLVTLLYIVGITAI